MKRLLNFFIALALGLSLASAAFALPETVKVKQGALVGVTADGITSFKGIPFAAPPVGDLRWKAPQPAPKWKGARDATKFGASCVQASTRDNMTISEDCLTLNVWSPAKTAKEKLPVMVWIYGGAFVQGSSSFALYDGAHFANQGVVLVTLNYRIGRLGFFAHPALTAADSKGPHGNYGLMDQIAALQWVKANIARFGGDPKNVTIFGESAGGMSVNYLMTSPPAQGLFHKAISQSGFARTELAEIRTGARNAEAAGVRWATAQGLPETIDAAGLRALPIDKVSGVSGGLAGAANSFPMLDGAVLTQQPYLVFAAGKQAKVPFMLGGTSYEASLFRPTEAGVLTPLGAKRAEVVALFGSEANLPQVVADIATDGAITEPNRALARASAKSGQNTFLYYFDYVPAAARAVSLGVPHGGEIRYVFGTLAPEATAEDRAASSAANRYWAQFAKTGAPGSAGGPEWPAYDAAADQWMVFDHTGPHVVNAFRKPQLDYLEARAEAPAPAPAAAP